MWLLVQNINCISRKKKSYSVLLILIDQVVSLANKNQISAIRKSSYRGNNILSCFVSFLTKKMSEWRNIHTKQNDICSRSETQSNDLSEKSKGRKSWLWNSKAGKTSVKQRVFEWNIELLWHFILCLFLSWQNWSWNEVFFPDTLFSLRLD